MKLVRPHSAIGLTLLPYQLSLGRPWKSLRFTIETIQTPWCTQKIPRFLYLINRWSWVPLRKRFAEKLTLFRQTQPKNPIFPRTQDKDHEPEWLKLILGNEASNHGPWDVRFGSDFHQSYSFIGTEDNTCLIRGKNLSPTRSGAFISDSTLGKILALFSRDARFNQYCRYSSKDQTSLHRNWCETFTSTVVDTHF